MIEAALVTVIFVLAVVLGLAAASVRVLREFTDNLRVEEPLVGSGISRRLRVRPLLGAAARMSTWPLRQVQIAVRDEVLLPAETVNHSWLHRPAARVLTLPL